MADETATLRDTAVVDPPADTKAADATTADTSEIKITEAPNPEAAEIGRILLESGFSKDQLNDLMTAPKALESLRNAIQNDPQEFIRMLERTDPRTAERFQESLTDLYITRHGDKAKSGGKVTTDSATNDLMREVEALREKTAALETREQRRENAIAIASAQKRYDVRVDSLLDIKEVKEMNFTPSEKKALRATLSTELAKDPQIVQRVSTGNFVDIAPAFKGIIEEWANDKKSASDEAKAARDRSSKGSFADFLTGPNAQMLDIPSQTFDSWDATEDGLAKALERMSK